MDTFAIITGQLSDCSIHSSDFSVASNGSTSSPIESSCLLGNKSFAEYCSSSPISAYQVFFDNQATPSNSLNNFFNFQSPSNSSKLKSASKILKNRCRVLRRKASSRFNISNHYVKKEIKEKARVIKRAVQCTKTIVDEFKNKFSQHSPVNTSPMNGVLASQSSFTFYQGPSEENKKLDLSTNQALEEALDSPIKIQDVSSFLVPTKSKNPDSFLPKSIITQHVRGLNSQEAFLLQQESQEKSISANCDNQTLVQISQLPKGFGSPQDAVVKEYKDNSDSMLANSKLSPTVQIYQEDINLSNSSISNILQENSISVTQNQENFIQQDLSLFKIVDSLNQVEQTLRRHQTSFAESLLEEVYNTISEKLQLLLGLVKSTNSLHTNVDTDSEYELAQEFISHKTDVSTQEPKILTANKKINNKITSSERNVKEKEQIQVKPRPNIESLKSKQAAIKSQNLNNNLIAKTEKIIIFKAPFGCNAKNTKSCLEKACKNLNISFDKEVEEIKPLFDFVGLKGYNNWVVQLPQPQAQQLLAIKNIKIGKNFYVLDKFFNQKKSKFFNNKVFQRSGSFDYFCSHCKKKNFSLDSKFPVFPNSFNHPYFFEQPQGFNEWSPYTHHYFFPNHKVQ